MTNELQERYNLLASRCDELSSGESTINVKLEYSWGWDSGTKGNLWLDTDSHKAYSNLNKIEEQLRIEYDAKILLLIEDVDKFVADGGQWDYW